MNKKIALVLIDSTEVIIRIYLQESFHLQMVYCHNREFSNTDEIISFLAEVSISKFGMGIKKWIIKARNIDEAVVDCLKVKVLGEVELLTLIKEQDLLFEGILRSKISCI